MKNTIAGSLLMGLLVLIACTISNPTIPAANRGQSCSQNEICETTVPQNPVVARTPGLIATPAFGSRYYYVSTRGHDTNSGMKELPFQTIGKAANVAKAGDVVLIQAGIYYEDVRPLHSGEPGKYITYQGVGDGEVIIDAQDGQRAAGLEIDNKSYLQFVDLTVRGANSYQT